MHRSVHSRALSAGLAVALCVAMVFGGVLPAFADLEGEAKTLSTTNPNRGDGFTWRWNWGTSYYPDMLIDNVPTDGSADVNADQTLGFYYEFHQLDNLGNGFGVPVPGQSTTFLSPSTEGSMLFSTFDIKGVLAREGWTGGNGAQVPGEGLYGLSFRFYNQFRVEDAIETDIRFRGLDLTKPLPVENLTATAGVLPSANGWTEATWRDLRWTDKPYDALSGVGGYKISVNETELPFVHNVAPDPAYEPYANVINPGWTPSPQITQTTVEEMDAGANRISVVTVDRATNESSARTLYAYVDPDTPKLSVIFPVEGGAAGAKPTFTVKASDAAGISKVKYYVDGNYVGSASAAPWSLTADLSAYGSGTHTLKVEAEDKIGSAPGTWWVPHVATVTRTFRIDKTTPVLTLTSAGPSPFYPRKRDGYKDNFVVKFKSSEAAKATLTLKDSSGRVWRTITKSVPAGSSSVSWNGRSNSNTMKSGTFRWYLQLSDTAGNKSATKSGSVSLKYYEIIYVGGGARVIER